MFQQGILIKHREFQPSRQSSNSEEERMRLRLLAYLRKLLLEHT